MKSLTPEMIEKAKAAESAEELLAIAKANGVEMTADEAATYFAQLNPKSGELDDDDLDNVAGGTCGVVGDSSNRPNVRVTNGSTCPICGSNIGFVESNMYAGTLTEKIFCSEHNSSLICAVLDPLISRPYEPLN
jgi:predicted ribosomally synthesized peptide with nif11-like leader